MLGSLLTRLHDRDIPMPAPMTEFLLGQVRGGSPGPLAVHLTERELEVLQLIADGATNNTIAAQLGISVHGAKHHVANLLRQLNCSNRTEAAATAMRRGLVSTGAVPSEEPARRTGGRHETTERCQ